MKYIQSFSPLVLLVLSVSGASCASTQSKGVATVIPMENAVVDLSDELVKAARLRTDLSSMRVCVHEIRPEHGGVDQRLASISGALEREFVVALSNRINVLDLDAAKRRDLGEISDAHDVSHGLVGSFYERGDELVVTVKLVNARNQLIVAVARGIVPTSGFDVVGETEVRDNMLAVIDERQVAVAQPVERQSTRPPEKPIEAEPAEKLAAAEAPPTGGWVTTMGKRKQVTPGEARKPIGAPRDEPSEKKAFTAQDLAVSTGPAGRRLKNFTLKTTSKP